MKADRRLKGHPGPLLAKWQAEGRARPTEPFPVSHHTPLHYQQHQEDQRVILDSSGSPQLHHAAMELLCSAPTSASSGRRSWLSVPQVARLLELDPSTVRDAIKDGQLPATQPTGEGGSWRIRIDQFEAYLLAHHYTHDHIRELRTTWQAWLDAAERP